MPREDRLIYLQRSLLIHQIYMLLGEATEPEMPTRKRKTVLKAVFDRNY